MAVRIIADSTVDLRPGLAERVGLVPLTLRFGEEEYIDGVSIDRRTFYEKLIERDVLPTTSQANPASFAPLLEEAAAAGDEAVVITLSSRLSGTCQSARIAAGDCPGAYVVDSGSVSVGAGILTEYALRCADAGMDAAAIAEALEEKKADIRVIALLDTLEYLKKGGRISAAAAVAGGILNLRPVVSLEGGQIKVLGKARGSRQGNNLLVQEIRKAGGIDFSMPILLGYTGLSELLLKKYVEDSSPLWAEGTDSLAYTCIGSVVGTHAGPGAVATAFFSRG